jgi:hypothetical protein
MYCCRVRRVVAGVPADEGLVDRLALEPSVTFFSFIPFGDTG